MSHTRSARCVRQTSVLYAAGMVMLVLAACVPATVPAPQVTPAWTQVTPTQTQVSGEPLSYPLSELGPYTVSNHRVAFEDPSRENREVSLTVWYPAIPPEGKAGDRVVIRPDLTPDLSGAPYPLILSSSQMARDLAPYLVSRGFAWVSVNGINTYLKMREQMYEQPLDLLFALNQAASDRLEGLEGVIDAEHAGAIGYSFDGYNSLALSGARIDPAYYLAQCPAPDPTTEAILSTASSYNCVPADEWDRFTAQAGEAATAGEDGLWQPLTDERIRAVMPMACEGWWLFGERGLATVDRPTLIIVGAEDALYPENALIYEHLGTPDKAMITFADLDHMLVFQTEPVARMAHFAAAFFGTHLQGREDLAWYVSEDFVSQHADLIWGGHPGE